MPVIDSKNICVIVQGAIDKIETPKCLKSIRKFLPNAQIILSSWVGSDVSDLDYDVLVLNEDPGGYKYDFSIENKENKTNNFNRQLISTKEGLLRADREYCLKLRSDLILKNADFLNYWDKFSCRKDKFKIFKHRVIVSSIYSRESSCLDGNGLPTPFHPSDFWFFGLSDDIKDYFMDCPMQTKKQISDWDYKYPNRLPYSSVLWQYAPEQVFCVNWVKKYYPDLEFVDWSDWREENIELSNNIIYNNFIFLDFEQSGMYSKKHYWGIENCNEIEGLISYIHFQRQYKKYCDNNYNISYFEKNQYKLHKHYKKLTKPLY